MWVLAALGAHPKRIASAACAAPAALGMHRQVVAEGWSQIPAGERAINPLGPAL